MRATLLLITIGMTLVPRTSVGQDTLPSLRYLGGRLDATHIPYGRPFKIRGSTALPLGRADAVRLTMNRENASPDQAKTACWIRSAGEAGDTVSQFTLIVPIAPRLEKSYDFQFQFLQELDQTRGEIKQTAADAIADAVEDIVDDLAGDPAGEIEFTAGELRRSWQRAAQRRFAEALGPGVTVLDLSKPSQCPPMTRLIRATDSDLATVRAAVLARIDREASGKKQQESARDFRSATADRRHFSLRGALEQALQDNAAPATEYTTADVISLFEGFELDEPAQSVVTASFRRLLEHADIRTVLDASPAGHLERLLDLTDALREADEELAEAETTLTNAVEAAKKLDVLEPVFVPIATAALTQESFADTAKVRALRIGTAYVLGGAVMGWLAEDNGPVPKGPIQIDAISLFLVKLHLGAVDKTLPNPYSSPFWAHVSLNVGAMFLSTLHYAEQEQEALFTGITPAIGIGYDIDRFLAIHVGAVVFRQPSPNAFNIDRRRGPFAAPYIALGFDFNLLNLIKNATKE